MSKSIEEQIREEQEAHKERVAALRKKQREEDQRIDREALRIFKDEHSEQWEQLRERARQNVTTKRKKRSALTKAVRAQQQEAQTSEHVQDGGGAY